MHSLIQQRLIPGGTFKMGSDVYYPSERSADDVTVESFCIDKYEVTNAEQRAPS
ncbi:MULTISPECIES: SUMF1/EgtB/PvdO family nonheme iron enzyme [unclassified Moorena]|uniref:SUMF1/EgtB/PvdO family nonheme iron enzyme n=1 Tax=unclassified Moorena TaxID=2683338 RepID=UPI00338F4547